MGQYHGIQIWEAGGGACGVVASVVTRANVDDWQEVPQQGQQLGGLKVVPVAAIITHILELIMWILRKKII